MSRRNRRLFSLTLATLFAVAIAMHLRANDAQAQDFSENWLYMNGDAPEGRFPETIDRSWQRISLPHQAQAVSDDSSSTTPYSPGVRWYRKHFSIPQSEFGQRIHVVFDNLFGNARIWLNGHTLGSISNQASNLRYDLTPHLGYGETESNVISVRIEPPTSLQTIANPHLSGQVWLVHSSPIKLQEEDLSVKAFSESVADNANVQINASIENASNSDAVVRFETKIVTQGNEALGLYSSLTRSLRQSAARVSPTIRIANASVGSNVETKPLKAILNLYLEDRLIDHRIVPVVFPQHELSEPSAASRN